MIDKQEAIALRVIPFSETSHIVIWLTRELGKFTGVIKGACRKKSLFAGQYDLYYTCEVVFYRKDREGVYIVKECAPLNSRDGIRRQWRAATAAAYVADLVSRVSLAGEHQPELYSLVAQTFDHLDAHLPHPALVHWFELHLLDALGLTPGLSACVRCGRALTTPAGRRPLFSPRHGGLLCGLCEHPDVTGAEQGAAPVMLPPDVLSLLRRWQSADSPRIAQNTRCTPPQQAEIARLLAAFLHYHLDRLPTGRDTVLDMLRPAPPVVRA